MIVPRFLYLRIRYIQYYLGHTKSNDADLLIFYRIHPTLVESKNVENKNECVGEDL
jgi:hypothetical protein